MIQRLIFFSFSLLLINSRKSLSPVNEKIRTHHITNSQMQYCSQSRFHNIHITNLPFSEVRFFLMGLTLNRLVVMLLLPHSSNMSKSSYMGTCRMGGRFSSQPCSSFFGPSLASSSLMRSDICDFLDSSMFSGKTASFASHSSRVIHDASVSNWDSVAFDVPSPRLSEAWIQFSKKDQK